MNDRTETTRSDPDLEAWIEAQEHAAVAGILRCVSATGLVKRRPEYGQVIRPLPGSILASPCIEPEEQGPDYFYHWIRDSSIPLEAIRRFAESRDTRADWAALFEDVLAFSVRLLELDGRQLAGGSWRAAVTGDGTVHVRSDNELAAIVGDRVLGEVRFNADATLDLKRWSRPQNDGPALRALTVLRWLRSGVPVSEDAEHNIQRLLIADLDYTVIRAEEPCYDIWEEAFGWHYYTRLVQATALERGASWARAEGNEARAAGWDAAAARLIEALGGMWSPEVGIYRARIGPMTRDRPDRLDSAVILAVLHTGRDAPRHSVRDPRLRETVGQLERLFADCYPLNRDRPPGCGVFFGRYENDQYYSGGPWFLSTLGIAEYWYRLARDVAEPSGAEAGERAQSGADLLARGDAILRTVRRFAPSDGTLPEQADPSTGAPASAKDLAWSHAAFLSAIAARIDARAAIGSAVGVRSRAAS